MDYCIEVKFYKKRDYLKRRIIIRDNIEERLFTTDDKNYAKRKFREVTEALHGDVGKS